MAFKQRTRTRHRIGLTIAACSGALGLGLGLMGTGQASAATGLTHEIVVSNKHVVKYTALGDSYVSSPGIDDQVDATCARSDNNYPSLVARDQQSQLKDVSCQLATTDDVFSPQVFPQASEARQLDAVDSDTDVVSMTFGINDIKFRDHVTACLGLTASDPTGAPCQKHFNANGSDELADLIQQTGPKVLHVLQAVHARTPHARLLVVGYPDLFPDNGTSCTSSTNPLAAGDFTYLRDTEKKLNAMLANEAQVSGAQYVDTYTPTIGHDICAPATLRWIEPLVTAPPLARLHPNAQGNGAVANSVESALD